MRYFLQKTFKLILQNAVGGRRHVDERVTKPHGATDEGVDGLKKSRISRVSTGLYDSYRLFIRVQAGDIIGITVLSVLP
jgi:hypothetical protein